MRVLNLKNQINYRTEIINIFQEICRYSYLSIHPKKNWVKLTIRTLLTFNNSIIVNFTGILSFQKYSLLETQFGLVNNTIKFL